MRITYQQVCTHTVEADLFVIGVYAKTWAEHPLCKEWDKALGGMLFQAAQEQDFSGKAKQQLVLHTLVKPLQNVWR